MEEKILQYVNEEMSLQERDEFERTLQKDPLLKQMVDDACMLSSAFSTKLIRDIAWDDMIEDFLNDSMAENEKIWFENRLNEDEALRSKLEQRSLLMAAFATKKIADTAEQELKVKSIKRWSINALSSVAVLACVVLAGCGVCNKHNEFLADNYLTEMYEFQSRGTRSRGGGDIIEEALEEYRNGNAEGAIKILDLFTKGDSQYDDAMYIKGMILLKDKWFSKEAIECLKASENSRAKELLDSIWLKFLY